MPIAIASNPYKTCTKHNVFRNLPKRLIDCPRHFSIFLVNPYKRKNNS